MASVDADEGSDSVSLSNYTIIENLITCELNRYDEQSAHDARPAVENSSSHSNDASVESKKTETSLS